MIEFRQKDFSKIVNSAKENPISVIALGISTANLANNMSRRKQDRKYHDAQIEATERLTEALEKDTASRETINAARKYKKSVKNVANNAEPTLEEVMAKFKRKKKI